MPISRSERLFSAFVGLSLVLVILFSSASGQSRLDGEQALQVLVDRIERDRLYSGTNSSCLVLSLEKTSRRYFEFAIREMRGEGCPAAAGGASIDDRFRVSRLTRKVQWYEPLEGDWLPYSALRKARTTSDRPSAGQRAFLSSRS